MIVSNPDLPPNAVNLKKFIFNASSALTEQSSRWVKMRDMD